MEFERMKEEVERMIEGEFGGYWVELDLWVELLGDYNEEIYEGIDGYYSEIRRYDENISGVEWVCNDDGQIRVEVEGEGVDIRKVLGRIKERSGVEVCRVLGLKEGGEFYEYSGGRWVKVEDVVYEVSLGSR